jgi:hypothetical protein
MCFGITELYFCINITEYISSVDKFMMFLCYGYDVLHVVYLHTVVVVVRSFVVVETL